MRLTARDRALLGVVAALALCAAFYVLALEPEHRRASQLQTQIAAANATLASAQRNDASGHLAEVALRRTKTDWTAAQRAVPNVADIPALLKLLQRSADAARVTIQDVSLSGSSASSSSSVASAAPSTVAGATTIPVSLTFNGGYQALSRLIDKLDTFVTVSQGHLRASGPLVGISDVSVNPADSVSNPSKLSVQLTATIYQHSAAATVLGNSTEG